MAQPNTKPLARKKRIGPRTPHPRLAAVRVRVPPTDLRSSTKNPMPTIKRPWSLWRSIRQIRAPASPSIKQRSRRRPAWNFTVKGGRTRSSGSSDRSC